RRHTRSKRDWSSDVCSSDLLTDEQVAELARLAREVLLAFDADRSGQEAMLRVQRAAAGRGIILKVVRLPDDKDPCDLLLEEGPRSEERRVGKECRCGWGGA